MVNIYILILLQFRKEVIKLSDSLLQMILCQRIGIFYKTHEYKQKMFERIVDFIPNDYLTDHSFFNTRNEIHIRLKDGTTINFINIDSSRRGFRLTKIIVEPGINEDTIHEMIMPHLINTPVVEIGDNENYKYL